jgi:ribosome-associated protein
MTGGDLDVQPGLVIPGDELVETASRAGGPGGQHVDKASTRVSLRWGALSSRALSEAQRRRLAQRLGSRLTREGELVVHARRQRSRARNRALARERLAELVRGALARPRSRIGTRPGGAARERRRGEKRRRSEAKRARRPPRED